MAKDKYISILRGINVSGQKKIIMSDLKILYEHLGFLNITTYIQSGNVVFENTSKNIQDIKKAIETAIEKKYNFIVPVNVRRAEDYRTILNNLPFKNIDIEQEGTKILITFLSETPEESNIIKLQEHVIAPEKLILDNQVIYLHCPNGYGKTKLSNGFIENKLKVTATTRNIKTVIKLCELSGV